VLEADTLTPSIWVLFNPICIYGFLLLWEKKCRLFFVYLLIVLLEARSKLSITIYSCFSFSGVLSSPLRVARPSTKRLRPDFDNFCWEIFVGFQVEHFLRAQVFIATLPLDQGPLMPMLLSDSASRSPFL
jgi:hypothetical protein